MARSTTLGVATQVQSRLAIARSDMRTPIQTCLRRYGNTDNMAVSSRMCISMHPCTGDLGYAVRTGRTESTCRGELASPQHRQRIRVGAVLFLSIYVYMYATIALLSTRVQPRYHFSLQGHLYTQRHNTMTRLVCLQRQPGTVRVLLQGTLEG